MDAAGATRPGAASKPDRPRTPAWVGSTGLSGKPRALHIGAGSSSRSRDRSALCARQAESTERTGQKIPLHGELSHLGAQIADLAFGILQTGSTVFEHFAGVLKQLLAPRGDLRGMHAMA